jgi:hypothetical protein
VRDRKVILFVPDKFMDYRMWNDIPDRIRDHAEIVHVDQHAQIPWTTADDDGFVDAVRQLAGARTFDIVVAAGQAARFGFTMVQAGLAGGLMLFYPSPDRPMEEVSSRGGDLDPADVLSPYLPVLDALRETDISRQREILMEVVSDTAGADVDMAELDRALGMVGDHAEEFFAELREQPEPPWLGRPWIDHLAELTVPVTAVVAPGGAGEALGEAITRRAADAEIVVASPRVTPVAEASLSADALLRMLDRVTC